MKWIWKNFDTLTVHELYAITGLRERVFVVEQNCVYLDADGLDPLAWHLLGFQESKLTAYLRVFPANIKYKEVSFGRVVTAPEARGRGSGKLLTQEGLERIRHEFGDVSIRISAQAYLEKFYGAFGFVKVGGGYMEDNIPHIEMVLEKSGP